MSTTFATLPFRSEAFAEDLEPAASLIEMPRRRRVGLLLSLMPLVLVLVLVSGAAAVLVKLA